MEKRKVRKSNEADNQIAFFDWLHLWNKDIAKCTFHIPNGGSRHPAEAKNLKRMGVKPGVPDVFCAIPAFGYNGLFIEFKSENGKTTDLQEKMIDLLTKNGYKVVICYSWLGAKETMEWYQKGCRECLMKSSSEKK